LIYLAKASVSSPDVNIPSFSNVYGIWSVSSSNLGSVTIGNSPYSLSNKA